MPALCLLAVAAQSVSGCILEAVPPTAYAAAQDAPPQVGSSDRWLAIGNDEYPSQVVPDGIVLVYRRGQDDTELFFDAAIDSPVTGEHANFGAWTAVTESLLVVGAPGGVNTGPSSPFDGAAVVYRHDGSNWLLEAILTSPRSQVRDRYAITVAVASSGGVDRIAVGAPGQDQSRGAVFLFEHDGSSWAFVEELNPSLATSPFDVGERVSFDGSTLVASEVRRGGAGTLAHIFRFDPGFGFWREEDQLPDTVGFALQGDSVIYGRYDRFADRTDILEAVRDPVSGSWSDSGPPLVSLPRRTEELATESGRLLITSWTSPYLALYEEETDGTWSENWQPPTLENHSGSPIQTPLYGTGSFSRRQVVSVAPGTFPLPYDRVVIVDPECNAVGDLTCLQATGNSTGYRGKIRIFGELSLAADDVTLQAVDLPICVTGLFFTGRQSITPMAVPGSEGTLCVGGDLGRFDGPGQICTTGDTGSMELTISPLSLPSGSTFVSAVAGESWHFQAWHRDQRNGVPTSGFTSTRQLTWQ